MLVDMYFRVVKWDEERQRRKSGVGRGKEEGRRNF
jgi:hypothetical protein